MESKNATASKLVDMDDQLSKPYKVAQLGEKIDLWLHHKGITQDSSTFPLIDQSTEPKNNLQRPTFEATALAEIAGDDNIGDSELLDSIIATFDIEAPKLLYRLNQAADKMNREAISREAHSLKSSSLALGGQQLSAYCRTLEKTSAKVPEEQLMQHLDNCNKEYVLFSNELHRHLAEAKKNCWKLTDMKLIER